MSSTLTGRCWRFGDNVNTDLMWPAAAFRANSQERLKLVFSAIRPGWSDQVRQGDIIVAGVNFGTGSGRPAPTLLHELGIVAVVAETVNGLFLRNCVNSGVVVLECSVPHSVKEADEITVDGARGTVTTTDGVVYQGEPLPGELLQLAQAGGVISRLREQGYIE